MPVMAHAKKSDLTRKRILDAGRELMLTGGFGGAGLKALLEQAEVPKGSFYHYFASKEAFGCAVLEDYVAAYLARFGALLAQPTSGADRLMHFWSAWLDDPDAGAIADRCLVVRLGAEISDLSDDMRLIMNAGIARLVDLIGQLLEEGIADGSIRPQSDIPATASVLYGQFLGAAILAKLSRDKTPLHNALADTKARLLP